MRKLIPLKFDYFGDNNNIKFIGIDILESMINELGSTKKLSLIRKQVGNLTQMQMIFHLT